MRPRLPPVSLGRRSKCHGKNVACRCSDHSYLPWTVWLVQAVFFALLLAADSVSVPNAGFKREPRLPAQVLTLRGGGLRKKAPPTSNAGDKDLLQSMRMGGTAAGTNSQK